MELEAPYPSGRHRDPGDIKLLQISVVSLSRGVHAVGADPQIPQASPQHWGTLILFPVGVRNPKLELVASVQWGWRKGAGFAGRTAL